MTPQNGPHSAVSINSMPGYPTSHQSPGPSPAGRGWSHAQGGFSGPGMAPQGYGNIQMPGSAGGYGQDQNSAGWGQPSATGFSRNTANNGNHSYGGY